MDVIERREISRGPACPAEEGEPVVVEVCEDHRDGDRATLDGDEPRLSKGGLQMAGVTDARLATLIQRGRSRIDGHGRVPEQTDGCHAMGVVPDTGAHHTAGCEHPPPFGQRCTDVGNEVQDEAGDHDVDRAIREPGLDRRSEPERRARVRQRRGGALDERLRRIDADDRARLGSPQDRVGQGAGPTPDIQPASPGRHVEPAHELVGDQPTPATVVSLVGVAASPFPIVARCQSASASSVPRPAPRSRPASGDRRRGAICSGVWYRLLLNVKPVNPASMYGRSASAAWSGGPDVDVRPPFGRDALEERLRRRLPSPATITGAPTVRSIVDGSRPISSQ